MLTDARTLLILALASVIIVPWIVCLVLQAADNWLDEIPDWDRLSDADMIAADSFISRNPRDEDADRQRLIDGDRFCVPPSFHSAPLVAEAQRDHVK